MSRPAGRSIFPALHFIQANTNGRLHPATEPSVSPLNRGFLYGDAIYEVWRTYDNVIFAWEEHWSRLRASAEALYFPFPFEAGAMLGEIRRTVAGYRQNDKFSGDLYIRLQITRGGGPIGLDIALADRPDFVLLVQPCPEVPPEKVQSGLRLSLAASLRRNPAAALDPAWKTGNYLNNLLCLREARARGADEVLILNLAGEITEAAVSNVAFVRRGAVVTPPLAAGLLGGITRGLLLGAVAPAAGVAAAEGPVRPEDLAAMDECFLLSTTKGITPVAAVDAVAFKVGGDTVTARLRTAFADYVRTYTAGHPKQRLL